MVGERLVKGAVFLALIVLATGCRHKDEPLKPLVIVDKPAKEDVQIFGEYVGRIRAARFWEIHARVEGYLEKMLFVEGKEVKQNEPLFIINSALYKAKVEKAKAQLKKNEAQAAKAKRDVERLQPLYEQHAASQLDLDNALASLGDAEADIAMSKADLDQAQLELSYTTVTSPLAGYISERFVDVGALVGPGVNSKLAAVVKSDTVLVDFKMTALDY
ncbi:efflux RND transporter periplasmic adaptor subunit, partial [Parabacteroides merdae]|nr:efflux RND transporter periplasmic adaptor subunit [Parabacteroides merdae]